MSARGYIVCAAGVITVQAIVLYSFGQPPICTCGYVRIWEGVVLGAGNSQHLTDWYSFSHVIHGFLFYLLLWWLFPRMSAWKRLLLAIGLEAMWEIIENTPAVIQHYRAQALAQGYIGDSIINSVSDTLMMVAGFVMAWRMPTWLIVVIALFFEIFVAYMIRDNLTLNVINLIHVFPSIAAWQAGA
ncbi:hypothetical protein A3A36_01825 [Candidatus Kaiserbacteria bacterium RIFCSPLOWO2_01_FULL_52_12b]|uniref:Uncharacterized protein n=1 Tax=Candidatus Kaiserbacteria bacterium RIFCSPLOWO2_01_FULL_52_12b TaxID=1798509 RepID=A0A1F6EX76_9BACT|nr:MAG: hypothetical protein A3A36_01825 [Candidatus Kaiserbacteria bacterium RIFCSPLOWO2_01_FULL_52_12b]